MERANREEPAPPSSKVFPVVKNLRTASFDVDREHLETSAEEAQAGVEIDEHRADVPIVEPVARWAGDQDIDRVIVVDCRVEAAPGAKDSSELEEPGILQITDVSEDRAGVNQPERIILKRKMRVGRRGRESERWAEMILAPEDMLGADVGAQTSWCSAMFLKQRIIRPEEQPKSRIRSPSRNANPDPFTTSIMLW